MSRKLQTLIKLLIAATFFVPLIVLPSSYIFPFIVPKIVWFRSLALIMLGGYILLLASNWQEYKIRLTPLNIAIGLFFISFGVSTFAGVDWYHSFWDNHERMLGLFTIFHFTAYYYIISSVIKEWRDWRWILRIFLFAGSIVMFIGFWQKYVDPNFLLNQGSDRVSATLGNAIYFSGYGMFLFFIGLLLFLKEEIKGWKIFALVGGILGFLGIFWGGTRGTLLGLAFGLLVLCLSYLITLKEYKKTRKMIGIILAVGVALVLLIVGFRNSAFVQKIPGVSRLVDTDFTIKNSKIPRVMAWGIAYDAFKEKPVFGWGPNNYYFAFNKYYRAEFLESGWGETWFDNAHNIIMNTLAVQGGVGIVIYFGLFGAGFYSLIKAYHKKIIDQHVLAIGLAFLVAHFVHNVTVFEDPTSYLYFFFFLAFVNSQSLNHSIIPSLNKKIVTKEVSVGLMVVVGLVVALFVYSTDINPARANMTVLDSIRNLGTNPELGMEFYKTAVAIPTPHIDDIRNDFSRTASTIISQVMQENKADKDLKLIQDLYDLSATELLKNQILHPLDIRVNVQLAQLYILETQIKKDSSFALKAESELKDALVKSPKRQQLQFTLAPLELQFGKIDEATKLYQDSINNDPLIGEGWWRLAYMYKQIGQIDLAKKTIQEALNRNVVFDSTGQQVEAEVMGATTTAKNLKIK